MSEDTQAGPDAAARAKTFEAAYVALHRSGELWRRAEDARHHLENCDLCARYCRVNRIAGIKGAVCRTGVHAVVYSAGPHHGEEDCLRGWRGSGTVFFSWCNLRCIFCQNWEIAWKGEGREVTAEELAQMMVRLQEIGCHNINLVTPSTLLLRSSRHWQSQRVRGSGCLLFTTPAATTAPRRLLCSTA